MEQFKSQLITPLSKNVTAEKRGLPIGFLSLLGIAVLLAALALTIPTPDLLDGNSATAQAPSSGAGAVSEERILYDFAARNLLIYGVYSAKLHGKKNGVEAENAARREGKQALTDHLTSICQNSQQGSDWQEQLKLRKDWSPSVLTSQGSEIFPDAALLIRLQAQFSSVFSHYPATKLSPVQNTAKENFVFKMPPIPASLMRCGTVELRISPARVIRVAPGYAGQVPPDAAVITLVATKERLEAATATDAEALKRSELGTKQDSAAETGNSPTHLPLSYKSAE